MSTAVFQDPITHTYWQENGREGFACARCGNGYATATARDDLDAHGCEGFARDLDTFSDSKGILDPAASPKTAEIVEVLNQLLTTVEFAVVWEQQSRINGFGGDHTIMGRDRHADGSRGPWKPLADAFWLYLDHHENPVTLDDINTFLDPDEKAVLDTTDLRWFEHQAAHTIVP